MQGLILGPPGTSVVLGLRRGRMSFEVTLVRMLSDLPQVFPLLFASPPFHLHSRYLSPASMRVVRSQLLRALSQWDVCHV